MAEALETALSIGDEAAGRVVLRGHDLSDLAERHDYETVAAVLWDGVVPAVPDRAALAMARAQAFADLAPYEPILRGRTAADAMRILVAATPGDDPLRAVAQVGIAATLAIRTQDGLPWLPPQHGAGHAADLLAMATGAAPSPQAARALERYMILMIDHGISASTHGVRIAASTAAPMAACLAAGLSVLEGVRHGGAPGLVIAQLDAIAGAADVPRFVTDARAQGRRLIGFGSRAYRGRDLRADAMKAMWREIGGDRGRRAEAEAIEHALEATLAGTMPGRGLKTNVEFYAALLLEALGLPPHGFTPMFAAGRSAGWVAHRAEQMPRPRILRPEQAYVGIAPA